MDYRTSAKGFEPEWRRRWAEQETYRTPNPGEPGFDASREKFVILDFFPYPSGIGLHIGHPLGYIATDVKARFMRMRGFNVLYSMGFDSFGLPAEQYAIQTGQHPRVTTENNVGNMLEQLSLLALSHDASRRFLTSEPEYYRWTQWIFLRLYNSFYDPEEVWVGPDGRRTVGRARPIETLAERLRGGEWVLDESGVPAPRGRVPAGRAPSDDELPAALDRARLAYVDEVAVNWCPMLGTVLSNEEVTNEGRSERGDFPVYKRPLKQWMLRITTYADRLIGDLAELDWPKGIVQMQKDWIGRSEGAQINFRARTREGGEARITVFTTRPDTLFGATFLVLAPDHALVNRLVTPGQAEAVRAYQERAALVKAARGQAQEAEKTGIFTGAYAVNPASGEEVPIWIADYVLTGYGTGAIMSVPAHDSRDFEFAKAFSLPLKVVVQPPDEWLEANKPAALAAGDPAAVRAHYLEHPGEFADAFAGEGVAVNSAGGRVGIDGLATPEAKAKINAWVVAEGIGKVTVQYKLRDWLFSRQRYWGEPFPMVFDEETERLHPLAEGELPVRLPELKNFEPVTGQSPDSVPAPPLARASEWMHVRGVVLEDGSVRLLGDDAREEGGRVVLDGRRYEVRRFRRDANTMPNWAGSCWYYLRYFDPSNAGAFVGREAERYWAVRRLPDGRAAAGAVDLYVGGAEHAVLHLLYARFWHKVLYDLGEVSTPEPFNKLYNQGMITADAYRDARGVYVDVHDVAFREEAGRRVPFNRETGERLVIDPGKMGKRYKNGIPPEEVIEQFTVDTFRLYEMFMGPLDASKPWQPEAIVGLLRFLQNVWRLAGNVGGEGAPPDPEVDRLVHKTIRKVTGDIDALRHNTAIAALMELTNAMLRQERVAPAHMRALVLLLSPFAPHVGEELASRLFAAEHERLRSVVNFEWPSFDPEKTREDEIEVPIQVNGKKRSVIVVPADVTRDELEALALADSTLMRYTAGKTVERVVSVVQPNRRLVNVVVR